jgi:hypothetical protein
MFKGMGIRASNFLKLFSLNRRCSIYDNNLNFPILWNEAHEIKPSEN